MELYLYMFTHRWLPLVLLGCALPGQQAAVPNTKLDPAHPVTIKVRFVNYKNGKPLKGLRAYTFSPWQTGLEMAHLPKSNKDGLVDVSIPVRGSPIFELAEALPWHPCGVVPIPAQWGMDETLPLKTLGQVPIETIVAKGVTMDINPGHWCPLTEAQAQALYAKYPPQPGIITYFMFREPYWFF